MTLPLFPNSPATPKQPKPVRKPQSPRGNTRKGARVEREIAAMHADLGIRAERVPLSGALAKRLGPDYGGDLNVFINGDDAAPMKAEVKARAEGAGFKTLERWIGSNDLLILKRNGLPPLIVLPWRTYARLILGVRNAGA